MQRRDFLLRTSALLSVAAAASSCATQADSADASLATTPPDQPADWDAVRAQFNLDPSRVHLAGFFLVSHPRVVREAIERYRRELDKDPVGYYISQHTAAENRVRKAAGEYLGVDGEKEIALTDSTTMGLSLLYNGLKLREGQEILTTPHDHPIATRTSLSFRTARSGASVREIRLYEDSANVSVGEIVSRVQAAITPTTRVLAFTWVHSCTGVKLPVRAVADAVADINKSRDERDRVLLCIDGVHGVGIDPTPIPQLGCDFLAAGTHKWVLAPRGTGFVWGRAALWDDVIPTIPPFGPHEPAAQMYTPGGFHSFEHRWAADVAFRFHLSLGKERVWERLRSLNHQIRAGLAGMKHVQLYTPMSDELAAGINCFDVQGKTPRQVVEHLSSRGIIGSVSPYNPSCARLAACVWNTPREVDTALAAVREMA